MPTLAEQNDHYRKTTDVIRLTLAVQELGEPAINKLLEQVRADETFTPDNDPHGEHDLGQIEFDGQTFFWKIDYYGENTFMDADNPVPHDASRSLTIMRADEY